MPRKISNDIQLARQTIYHLENENRKLKEQLGALDRVLVTVGDATTLFVTHVMQVSYWHRYEGAVDINVASTQELRDLKMACDRLHELRMRHDLPQVGTPFEVTK